MRSMDTNCGVKLDNHGATLNLIIGHPECVIFLSSLMENTCSNHIHPARVTRNVQSLKIPLI